MNRTCIKLTAGEEFDRGERDALTARYRMFTNDLEVQGTDRVVWNGLTLEVTGLPAEWDNPAGPHHTEFHLQIVEG